MKVALEGTLQDASVAIGEVSRKMESLPQQLVDAANAIRSSGEAATAQQRELANTLQHGLQHMLEAAGAQLVSGVRDGANQAMSELKSTGAIFGASADKLGTFIAQFTQNGDSYLDALKSVTAESQRMEGGPSRDIFPNRNSSRQSHQGQLRRRRQRRTAAFWDQQFQSSRHGKQPSYSRIAASNSHYR
jgi:hypothetical protein